MSKRIDDRVSLTCVCGTEFETTQRRIADGRGKFCSRACSGRMGAATHGMSRSQQGRRTYTTWATMKARCSNPRHPKYPAYGGSGIGICSRWEVFENFLADMGLRPEGTSIDRIDGSAGYSPGNCRWATPSEQQSNLRTNRIVTYRGDQIPLCEVARRLGVRSSTLRYRIDSGWPEERWGDARWKGNRSSAFIAVDSGLGGTSAD